MRPECLLCDAMPPVKLTLMTDGFCRQLEGLSLRGAPWRVMRFEALSALLEHPAGPILFDTGYSGRFFQETRRWPARLHRWFTPVRLHSRGSVMRQLAAMGISASVVRHVFISHFHADHIGGLRDFPEALFHCSHAAWQDVAGREGFGALRRAFLPGLIPEDFMQRVRFLEDAPCVRLPDRFSPFAEARDVLGDGSLLAVDLPGHAVGQMGLFLRDQERGPTLLAADGAWSSEAIRSRRPPSRLVRFLGDWRALNATLEKLHRLHLAHPEVTIIPTHCPEVWRS
ncbi:MAG: attM [Verrucomicrobiales bacterium]|nr:attM [Verrucomicrobiales bacterium]